MSVMFDSDWNSSGPWTCWRCRGKGVVWRLAWPFTRKCPECDGFGHRFHTAPVRSNKETQ